MIFIYRGFSVVFIFVFINPLDFFMVRHWCSVPQNPNFLLNLETALLIFFVVVFVIELFAKDLAITSQPQTQ